MITNRFCLIVPKLFSSRKNVDKKMAPYLYQFLRCSQSLETEKDTQQLLLQLFNVQNPKNISIASITAVADGLSNDGFWLRADPMALAVDLVHVYLLGNQHLQLTKEDVTHYLSLLNRHLTPENLQIVAPQSTRWYINVENIPKIKTHCPDAILGKSILDYFLTGPEALTWMRRMTEWQMLLYESIFNRERTASELPTVDALWLWGEGESPQITCRPQWDTVVSNDPIAIGLAKYCDIKCYSDENPLQFVLQNDSLLFGKCLVYTGSFAINDWDMQILRAFDRQYLKPLFKKRKVMEIVLYPGNGNCYHDRKSSGILYRMMQKIKNSIL